jgi:hypothetical protein
MKFNEEDKQNLRTTGNLGRIADVQYRQGETTPVLISLDRQTNELVAMKVDKVRIPEDVKGVQLDEKQKQALAEGKPVFVEGMTSKNGKPFDAYIQVNADKRGIEFRFDTAKENISHKSGLGNEKELLSIVSEKGMDGLRDPEFSKLTKIEKESFLERNNLKPFIVEHDNAVDRRSEELRSDNYDTARGLSKHMDKLDADFKNEAKSRLTVGEVRISKTLLGVELSDKRQGDLKAGQTVYVAGMKDPEGNDLNACVKVNADKSKLDFFKHHPDDNAKKIGEAPGKADDILKKNQAQPVEKQSIMKKPRGFKV